MAASIADLGKENPKYKNSLEEWRTKNYKKQQKHKASHCRQCNNKSLFYHYIYDKRTKKIEQTSSNATDPENQLVFCNQDSTTTNRRRIKAKEKEAQEAAGQLFDNLIADIQAGKDISRRNKPNSDTANNDLDEKTNDPADHHHSPTTPSGPTNNPEDNSGNGDDSSPTSPPSNGDSPTSSFTPNKPTGNDQEEKCGICDQTFTDAEEHGRENPQCQAFCEACEKILNQGQTVDYSSVATSERVDIDNLVLPIEAKENLKELRKQLGLYQDTTRDNPDEEKSSGGLNTQGKIGVSILSVGVCHLPANSWGIVFISLYPTELVIKKKEIETSSGDDSEEIDQELKELESSEDKPLIVYRGILEPNGENDQERFYRCRLKRKKEEEPKPEGKSSG
ncbi:11235_t:CDS:2 [Racocetra fulgida]|uniref:11235_t:CDS:1 n=1 Tax=Racocetra fulgida TaxID=60492 RepID=A0A9N8VBB4_9GLOM|nr:11235_t:CDS:2 [Racocetra fulgida]